jgi:xenotropic and polytropic retrovirus receptor 1
VIFCFYAGKSQAWKTAGKVELDECKGVSYVSAVIGFVPYWFRFAQCLVKYRDKPLNAHLFNAGKYATSLASAAAGLFVVKFEQDQNFMIFVAVKLVSTIYSYSWDLYMDWGLLRTTEKYYWGLRENKKILYHQWFYYFAIVTNFCLRFAWLIFIWNNLFKHSEIEEGQFDAMATYKVQFLILAIGEAIRRTQWALLRVENEQLNNFESYRSISIIPPIVEDTAENDILRLKRIMTI